MKTKRYTVNRAGIEEIRQFLGENHKLGASHFDAYMLSAWATEAEDSANNGGPAMIEVKTCDARLGHAVTYTISESGMDCEEIEIED